MRTATDIITTDKAEIKHLDQAEEVRTFPHGRLELTTVAGRTIGRATLEPGWRWSTDVKPLAGTESCDAPHFQYHVAGTLHVVMNDGSEIDCSPGDVSMLPIGHDAWVVGDEPAVIIDFQGMEDYAKKLH